MDELKQLADSLSASEKLSVIELANWTEQQEGCPIPRTCVDQACKKHRCNSSKLLGRLKLCDVVADVPRKRHKPFKNMPVYFDLPDLPNTPQNNLIVAECWELYQPSVRLMQLRELCSGGSHRQNPDSSKKPQNRLPRNRKVEKLCNFLRDHCHEYPSQIACARQFCIKHGINSDKAENMLNVARRDFSNLWKT